MLPSEPARTPERFDYRHLGDAIASNRMSYNMIRDQNVVTAVFKTLLTAFTLASCSVQGEGNRLPIYRVKNIGVELTSWLFSSEQDSLIGRIIDPDYSIQKLNDLRERISDQAGEEVQVIVEIPHAFHADGNLFYGYVRHSRFSKTERPVRTKLTFNSRGSVLTLEVTALPLEAPTALLDYRTKTKLRLPFDGEWDVGWGGRTIDLNQHAVARDQRFAYDFFIKREGYTFTGDGSRNQDYYCYDLEILAPGDGEVVAVENSVPENRPGEMPEISGNSVVIDHKNGEFSVLSHFRKGSIIVAVGDEVVSGQVVGHSGNTGHSSESHLHYHLQDTPVLHIGNGLPAQFHSYEANGIEVRRGEPLITQAVGHKDG